MGFMDKLGKMLGDDEPSATETVKGPSATLREHGIDPSNLKFSFNQDGTVTVAGHAQNQSECDRKTLKNHKFSYRLKHFSNRKH